MLAFVRSQILCQLTAKMTCGLKSVTLADPEKLLECYKFEGVDWHKVACACKFHQTCRLLTVDKVVRRYL